MLINKNDQMEKNNVPKLRTYIRYKEEYVVGHRSIMAQLHSGILPIVLKQADTLTFLQTIDYVYLVMKTLSKMRNTFCFIVIFIMNSENFFFQR